MCSLLCFTLTHCMWQLAINLGVVGGRLSKSVIDSYWFVSQIVLFFHLFIYHSWDRASRLSVNDSIWKWYRGLNDGILRAKSHNVAYHAYHTQIQNTERKLTLQNFESYTCDTLYFLLNWQKSCCFKSFFSSPFKTEMFAKNMKLTLGSHFAPAYYRLISGLSEMMV